MTLSSQRLAEAVDAFASLPGIGRKSALRLALHLLGQPEEVTEDFNHAVGRMRREVRTCRRCHYLSDEELCVICANPSRKRNLICVVESVRQVMAIEETGQYYGTYYVLGGLISPMEGIGPEALPVAGLVELVESAEERPEIILALSPTIEGETTSLFVSRQLAEFEPVISTIARGVSFGSDLEHADDLTLGRSIRARQPYSVNPAE